MGDSETTGAAVPARTQQQPSIGRQVRYLNRRGMELTATIAEIGNPEFGEVTLFVLDPTARTLDDMWKHGVIFADKLTQNCWSWPPRTATG